MKSLCPTPAKRAFSLIELLVSMSVLSLIMLLVFQMLDRTQITWKKSRDAVSEYKDARTGFEAITRRLSQATINPYWAYTSNAAKIASGFKRESDLHFVSGPVPNVLGTAPAGSGQRSTHAMFFHAPTGFSNQAEPAANSTTQLKYKEFPNLLNAWGYFVEFGSDSSDRPAFVNSLENKPRERFRFRLMEFNQPTERLQIYNLGLRSLGTGQSVANLNAWFLNNQLFGCNCANNYDGTSASASNDISDRTIRVVAENIIALILLPSESQTAALRADLSPKYYYDSRAWQSTQIGLAGGNTNVEKSRHALPPIVEVLMVAVDEADFHRYSQNKQIDSLTKVTDCDFTKNLFTTAANLDADLAVLSKTLSDLTPEIKFRIFRASVRLREAKWGGFTNISASN